MLVCVYFMFFFCHNNINNKEKSKGLDMALVKFESPPTWIISGMTGSGKTT